MPTTRPTVVLVHDGCSDATSWFGVIAELHRRGPTVLALANPLRGPAHDASRVGRGPAEVSPGRRDRTR
ncbi:hypothetical protein ACIRYZ_23960 [Kitasatospora sp. NPDC101155]|uniref:hypothetical protein n=1 Tax=Kitasatospora sp. NPDC101155 TaxID=3364097 RepID=UPI003803DF61